MEVRPSDFPNGGFHCIEFRLKLGVLRGISYCGEVFFASWPNCDITVNPVANSEYGRIASIRARRGEYLANTVL